jgi:hypothetical protein
VFHLVSPYWFSFLVWLVADWIGAVFLRLDGEYVNETLPFRIKEIPYSNALYLVRRRAKIEKAAARTSPVRRLAKRAKNAPAYLQAAFFKYTRFKYGQPNSPQATVALKQPALARMKYTLFKRRVSIEKAPRI